MPPRIKKTRSFTCQGGKMCHANTNPRVILRPFMAEPAGQNRSHFTTEPPTSSLFNKPEYSDLKLRVGSDYYFAHKVVLCAASEVFARMLSDEWGDCKNKEICLHEEPECATVFDRFLYYFYSGSIVISESYVIPLFMLADKYDVKPLHEECIKIIEKGLKVFVVESRASEASTSGLQVAASRVDERVKFTRQPSESSSSCTDESSSTEIFDSDDLHVPVAGFPEAAPLSPSKASRTLRLIGSETFSVSTVIKMLKMWHNSRISTAALYNLEARLGNEISQDKFATWNSLKQELVLQMLGDSNFCYSEYILFCAAKSWLVQHDCEGQVAALVLGQIRYPLLEPPQLYEVEKDPLVRGCPSVARLIQEAMRYQLFQHCCSDDDRSRWMGSQFQHRKPRIL